MPIIKLDLPWYPVKEVAKDSEASDDDEANAKPDTQSNDGPVRSRAKNLRSRSREFRSLNNFCGRFCRRFDYTFQKSWRNLWDLEKPNSV